MQAKSGPGLKKMTAHDDDWERWFAASEISPLRITYEELSAGPTKTLRTMLDRLGLERDAADGVEPAVAKLADDINQHWAVRFRSENHLK